MNISETTFEEPLYSSVGTLGSNKNTTLTCSEFVARKSNIGYDVLPYTSFELAAQALKEGKVNALLVPAAYPKANNLISDENLEVNICFPSSIPELVLVGKSANISSTILELFHHPATKPLIKKMKNEVQKLVPVLSNDEACLKLLAASDDNLAITNRLCADHHKLHILQTLQEPILMPWFTAVRKEK